MIELEGLPELNDPVMVAAFEGWNDAGDAASAAIEHLDEVFDATQIGEVDPDDYYDYQVTRPMVTLSDGVTRRIEWPTTRLSVIRTPGTSRDLVLVHGIEPNMRWRGFCADLLAYAHELGVETIVTLGALLADSPAHPTGPGDGHHLGRRAWRGRSVSSNPGTKGPRASSASFKRQPRSPACRRCRSGRPYRTTSRSRHARRRRWRLLRRLEDLLDIPVPLGDLPEEARAWERGVDELAADDAEVRDYVRALEDAKDTAELPEASGDAIAREFERYLRRRSHEQGGGTTGTPPTP